jgi:putative ABC transport system substrate-binding protein
MISRRRFIAILAGSPVAAFRDANAQQPAKVWRVGFLSGGARPADSLPPIALRKALQELGYVEGTNIGYAGRWAEAKRDRLPGLAAELVGLKVDLIATMGGPAAEAAKEATATIPIVISGAGDAIGIGLIPSLARPGGNITGIADQATELSAKRLELLREAVPKSSRVALLWNNDDRAMTLRYREVEKAARVLGVTIRALGVREAEDFEVAFSAMTKERPDALYVVSDALTVLNRKRVLDYANANRLPVMYENSLMVQDGGLMSYGPDAADNFRLVAAYIDRIFKGAKPGDLAVEQPNRYYLLVNLKTAKALGLTIPQSILLRADEVIQ